MSAWLQEPSADKLDPSSAGDLEGKLDILQQKAVKRLLDQVAMLWQYIKIALLLDILTHEVLFHMLGRNMPWQVLTIHLAVQGFTEDQIAVERFLNLRYDGTDVGVMTTCSEEGDYTEAFESAYKREFGFILEGRGIAVGSPSS